MASTNEATSTPTPTPQPTITLPSIPGLPPAHPTDDINLIISIITTSFATVPLTTTFITELDHITPPYPSPLINPQRLHTYFAPSLTTLATSGALILHSANHAAISIWEPPSFAGAPFTAMGIAGPIRTTWREKIDAAKKRELRGQPFWHLGFLARNPDGRPRVEGAVSGVVKPVLAEAERTRTPVWLEAVDERGIAIYEGWGFEVVEHVVLGVGVYGKDGWPVEGREGMEPSGKAIAEVAIHLAPSLPRGLKQGKHEKNTA